MKTKLCKKCGRMIRAKNEVGINLKLLGKNTELFLCFRHLAEYLNTTEDSLRASIEAYKYQGCPLFE